ncbi:tRNA1(Val) (adenine(37)-N6)-methyltransferase [Magnetospirillum molischianum]|uniref:Predicted O-methyltransferase n=1 Tax=Magnetospirillum molischianum DSM 120 TaxID=1150626 RepID=H8FXK0_MAGML|nr:methyltransferase [Magnetospirillum molischianum]CCG43088.1 Predicted O-methyltransferase [Magnetospirillum molischianum DSM 120]
MPGDDVGIVTEDRLIGGRVRICQPSKGYRAAIDPVFLAAAVTANAGETVLDLGCGVGAAGLCLLARQPLARVTGLELQAGMAALARRNALANGHVADNFRIVEGSALSPPPEVAAGGFGHVMTNPPFQPPGRGTAPPEGSKALAHVESAGDLSAWIKAAVRLLAPKGRLWVIHRADRLGELLAAFSGRGLGEVRVLPLWPKPGRPSGRVIVAARKGSRTPFALLPGLVLHRDDGTFTPAAEAVLRDAASIDWGG